MERPYVIKSTKCPFCQGEGYTKVKGETVWCSECNGKGYLNTVYDDINDPDNILNHENS